MFWSSRRELAGKVVLITGGGGGVGRAAAVAFARRGAHVLLWDLTQPSLDASKAAVEAATPGAKVQTAVVDLCRREAVYEAAQAAQALCWGGEQALPMFCVVNNAGIVNGAPILDLTDASILTTFQVNAISHFWTVRAFLPAMLARNEGHFVTIASVAGLIGSAALTDYCASKFAAVGLAESLHAELRSMGEGASGVKASCVCPAHIKTPLFEGFKQPLLPSVTPEDVAEAIVSSVESSQVFKTVPAIAGQATLLPKVLFPTWVGDLIARMTGMDQSMAGFNKQHAEDTKALMQQDGQEPPRSRL